MVTPTYFLPNTPPGGIAIHYRNLCEELIKMGHKVFVILSIPFDESDEEIELNGVIIKKVPLGYPSFITKKGFGCVLNFIGVEKRVLPYWHNKILSKVLKELDKSFSLDLIEFPNTYALLYSELKKSKKKIIARVFTTDKCHTSINSDIIEEYYLTRQKMESKCIKKASNIVVPTEEHKKKLIKDYKLLSEKIYVIPLGVPIPKSFPGELLNLDEKINILYVGRFEPRKGIDILLKAIPLVLAKVKNVKFNIVGKAHNGIDYEAEFRHLNNIIDSKNVEFLGEIKGKPLIPFFMNCDIFVAPSRWESFGLIYIEAMSHAKPVIACDVGGVKSIIDDGVDGLLSPVDDSEALAENIIELVNAPNKRKDLGIKAKEKYLLRYTSKRIASLTIKYYQNLLNN